jgi:hypothetical protein
LRTETALPNTPLSLHVPAKDTDPTSDPHKNKTLGVTNYDNTTNINLHITIPNTSSEGDYVNELYDGDEEYDVYDPEGSLQNYTDIKCTQKGLQCADRTTIMDCSENLNEPLFIMSCASLLHSDDGENLTGHCNNETPSCVLSSNGMTLLLNIKTISSEDSKICTFYSGLRCINNETLAACSGDTNSIHYAVSCGGTVTSNTSSSLQGHCYENSCMFVTVHQNDNSDVLANQSDNYETYHLLSFDTNDAKREHPYSNTSTETNTTNIQEEPSILTQQIQVFDLYNEYEDITHSLFKTEEEYFIDDRNNTETHTANSSYGEYPDLITDTAENILITTQDNLSQTDDLTSAEITLPNIGEPDMNLELLPLYTENSPEVTKPDGIDFYSETSFTVNMDYTKTTSENNVNTEIPDYKIAASASRIRSNISESILIKTTTQTPISITTETISSVPETIPTEIMMPISKGIHGEPASLFPEMIPTETTTRVSKSSQTETHFSVPETLPTETMAPVSNLIHGESVSPIPEVAPIETTNPVSKSSHTETDFSVHETLSTETMTPISQVSHRETDAPVSVTLPAQATTLVTNTSHAESEFYAPETLPTKTMIAVSKLTQREIPLLVSDTVATKTTTPLSKSNHTTEFSTPEPLSTETIIPVSKLVHTETAFPVPETTPIETTIPVSKSSHKETGFSTPDIIPTEIVIPALQAVHRETASPAPQILPTENITPVSEFIHTETAFSMTSPISKDIHRENASPLPEIIFAEAINFSSGTVTPVSQTTMLTLKTPLKAGIKPMLNTQGGDGDSNTELHFTLQPLKTVPTVHMASEAITLLQSAEGSGSVRMGTKSPTAETDQSQHLVQEPSTAMNEPFKVNDAQQNLGDFQKYACRKVGIQCMDSWTLAACLPDLTLSYTISCRTLLPYVMSKHHIVYCSYKLDTCALAQLN